MDILSQFFALIFRGFMILLPLTTGWLALRRLILSRSSNAWVYAFACLFAVATTIGLVPWSLGIAQTSWIFLFLAAFCPTVWLGVIMLCDGASLSRYEAAEDNTATFRSRQAAPPLILENPDWPGDPMPVFRHRSKAAQNEADGTPNAPPEPEVRSILAVARDMRGNKTSQSRRPKLLPPPDNVDLPFLTRT